MAKFIYVFDEKSKDILIAKNYKLLKSDTKNGIYVFGNKLDAQFSFNEINCAFSDTLTF